MKVLICDHADCMMPDHALEIETLRAGLGEDVEVEVLEYEDDKRDEFYEHVADADALLTGVRHGGCRGYGSRAEAQGGFAELYRVRPG